MLRYTLIFFLINIYGRSLGLPAKDGSNSKMLIGNLLGELSNKCKNEFVLDQIKSKYNTCNVEWPPYHEVNLQCLLFYDANRLMCNLTESDADLKTKFTAKLSETQSVSEFCSEAAHFNVPSATYQKTITTVFQNDVACKKVCAHEDILNGGVNFFCTYYHFTLTLPKLNTPQSPKNPKLTANPDTSIASGNIEEKNDNSTQVNHPSDGQVKMTSDPVALVTNAQPLKDETEEHPSGVAKLDTPSGGELPVVHNQESPNLHSVVDNTNQIGTQAGAQIQTAGGRTGEEKPTNVEGQAIDGLSNEASIDANIGAVRGADTQQIETPGEQRINVENDVDDDASMDMESDDPKEGDDRDDPIGGDMEVRIEPEAKNPAKHSEAQSQKDFFQTPDGFTGDDDHFFPFFLTAVIVVAVLYILYHNKNKVSKMFFGLIVEGRQPGRRRNSRGHAYRRLDTLEQAMSTNSTAPPSKIIY